jgi:membrane protein implicated in regulation of membrane protease activity/ribosomal protein L37AE/L43A
MSDVTAPSSATTNSVDSRVFLVAGVGGLIILVGLVMLIRQRPVYAALMTVPLLGLLAGLYWMKLADGATPHTPTQSGPAQMPQQPIGHDAAVISDDSTPGDLELGGDTPTVRADRPRLRAAKNFDIDALMRQQDNIKPPQCPNCGQFERLRANPDRTRARCADCGTEWTLGPVQPPTLVRSHVRTNVASEEANQPDGAPTARPN